MDIDSVFGLAMANGIRFNNEADDIPDIPSYTYYSEHSGMMMAHIIFMVIAWVFTLPVGIVFSIAGHRYGLVVRLIFLVLSGLGLISGIIVNTKIAYLYEGNVHHAIGWVATGMVVANALTDVLLRFTKRPKTSRSNAAESSGASAYPSIDTVHQSISSRRASINGQASGASRSNSGRDTPHASQHYHSGECDKFESDDGGDDDDDDESEYEYNSLVHSRQGFLEKLIIHKYYPRRLRGLDLSALPKMFEILYKVIDWTVLVVGFVALVTGGVVYTGIFQGIHIFNGLAHFIKGGIFFWYGLLTLGRWLGCFSEAGWAWNVKPPCTRTSLAASIPSAEFVESFVIFLYGSTNMFLEHLSGWGKAWVASDLEHVSISILFFAGGLCGMLVESQRVRALLNTKIERTVTLVDGNPARSIDLGKVPRTYDSSPNTVPALVIFLLGVVMSSHHQSSAISTTVHRQWGMLLAGFAVMRVLTYVVMYISPAASVFPSRPPSELVASFCLIAGGLVLMASTTDIVQWIEDWGLAGMFVFTIAVALTLFVMAWEVAVLAVKGWAERSEGRDSNRAGCCEGSL